MSYGLFMKRTIKITAIFAYLLVFLVTSCAKKTTIQSQYKECRSVVFDTTGYVLNPGDKLNVIFNLPVNEHKVKRRMRVTGASILPEIFNPRSEVTFRNHCYHIDDYLSQEDTYSKDDYALIFAGKNESFEKNAYYRLSQNQLTKFKGKKVQVQFPVKREIKGFGTTGFFKLRLQLYKEKLGRALDDIFDEADQVWELNVPEGESDWEVITKDFEIPEDIACILVQIISLNMSGECKVGTPSFKSVDEVLRCYPIQPYKTNTKGQENWIGENLSSKEWPEFEFAINGKPFFIGKIFDRASEVGEFDVNLPELPLGDYELSMKLLDRFPAKYPFLLKTIEIHENSARDFEVVYIPKFVSNNSPFGILIETNKPHVELIISGDKHIDPVVHKKEFVQTGLHALVFNAGDASLNQKIRISDGTNEAVESIKQIINKKDDGVYISTGDDIYISRSKEQWGKYLKWHMREGIGNSYCWRPSYQWSGARGADPEFYSWAVNLLQGLQMPYALMTEGRTIPGRNINPSDEVIDSPFYMGRQAHEDDGSFYYWEHFKHEGLYSDLAAKFRPYGGIFAKARPIHTNNSTFVHYDPYGVKDMADGAKTFVENLSKARGSSTRHTGPSTLFRYFFQAGYEWVGAEQMYGPEEVIMSSIRGACKAYNKKDFGTHLALQWANYPFNDTDHTRRFFLSLAISYIHGATHINTEEGVWNVESGEDRFSIEGKAHIKKQSDLLYYIQTHERRGRPVAPIAVIQGRNDAWKSFMRSNAWSQKGDEWEFGAPEEGFDLLKAFYPNSVMDHVYLLKDEPRRPKGFYTATPYGLVDLLPIEAPQEVLDDYGALAFLGWNSYQKDDFERMLAFVKKGKTLLLTGNHINTELKRNRPTQYPEDDKVLIELLGSDYKTKKSPYRHKVGKGEVIFYPQKLYPAESPIRNEYVQDLKNIGKAAIANQWQNGWVEAADNIEFAAWDWDDGETRTIYLLNIDWWSEKVSHSANLRIGDTKFPLDVRRDVLETVTVFQDIALRPQNMTTDVLDISNTEGGYEITVQTTKAENLEVYHKQKGTQNYTLESTGIHKIKINN
ncbi:hypothetical protein [Seonamhaeicola sp.]|uniref:hypothetical protein n=1 Tax=Seonamhaeicola sp. TaxID=1912245 RepID=UPI0026079C62|nr:hypothetical protein [Seonamhaeicola sp.]